MKANNAASLMSASHRGQTVVLVALMFVVLLGFAGLAVDVSAAYSTRRFERSVADAAALAGAQDLQGPTRTVTLQMKHDARRDALDLLVRQLQASGPGTCNGNLNADVVNCQLPGTAYHVWIRTPAQYGNTVTKDHAVQVSIYNPTFGTAFARLYNQPTWNVGLTSVAGLGFSAKYAVITLQPPQPRNNGTDANLNKDLIVNGNNTVLNVLEGDIGTNTSATTTLAGLIQLADGFYIYHYDDLSLIGDTWSKPDGVHPIGQQIPSLIEDPGYIFPSFAGARTFNTQAAGQTACGPADFPTDWTTLLAGAVCYQPGVYAHEFDVGTGGGPSVAYLMPGAYSFPQGMKMHGTLGGGLISNEPGIVMVLPQDQIIDSNNAVNFLLNAGGESCNADGCRASPAVDSAGTTIQTPAGLTITIEVTRDDDCFSGLTPIINAACSVNQNHTVNLAGTGTLRIGGILYGASDNMSINGGSSQTGEVGQIVSWSVTYTGGSTLNQSYPGTLGNGILRLDSACSGQNSACTP